MKIKKVMLIQPPGNYLVKPSGEAGGKLAVHPIGIAYIAAVLKKNGYDVKIIDALAEGYENENNVRSCASGKIIRYGLSNEEIKKHIEDYNPEIIGISCLQSTRHIEAQELCRIAKEVNPNIIVIMGGGHPTALPEVTLKDENVDYVVIGEGEYATLKLLEILKKGYSVKAIDGIAYREKGSVIIQPKTNWIDNLDELPMPEWNLLPIEKYIEIAMPPGRILKNKRWVTMYTSRGCPQKCSYCPARLVWGNKFRWRSPSNVIDEIEFLMNEYGIREFQFEDSNMTVNKNRMLEFCNGIIKSKLNISWSAPHGTAINTLDKEMLQIMKQSGCYVLYLAIESAEQEILDSVSKSLRILKVKPIVDLCKELGFMVIGYFMIGFLDEKLDNIRKTIEFANNLNLDGVSFFIATPLPGTKFYEDCKKEGYLRDKFDFTDCRYGIANIQTEEFSPQIIEKIRREGWLKLMKNKIDTEKYDKSLRGFEPKGEI